MLDVVEATQPSLEILDALQPPSAQAVHAATEESARAYARAWSATTDRLRELSPCEVSKLSEEEIWRPAKEVIGLSIEAGGDPGLQTLLNVAVPDKTSAIRRAGRLLVDRELTAKVLELRREKAASRDGRWPEKLLTATPGSVRARRMNTGPEAARCRFASWVRSTIPASRTGCCHSPSKSGHPARPRHPAARAA